jgi:hypothetical protein
MRGSGPQHLVAYGSRLNQSTQLFVIHQFRDGRVIATDGAVRITPNAHFAKAHGEGVVHQQATDEWLALADDELNGFRCLNHTNNPG